jgi:hypothetical protein
MQLKIVYCNNNNNMKRKRKGECFFIYKKTERNVITVEAIFFFSFRKKHVYQIAKITEDVLRDKGINKVFCYSVTKIKKKMA